MSLPSANGNGQSSIRNFFRPKPPAYAAPPSASKKDGKPSSPFSSVSPPPQQPLLSSSLSSPLTSLSTPIVWPAAATASTTTNLHPQASISRIQPEHVTALRRITSLLLPVNYPDSFYARLSDPLSSGAFSRVILWRDEKKGPGAPAKVIGGLVCRPEPSPFHAGTVDSRPPSGFTAISAQPNALYIQSLVLLSPYRGLGLAAALLDEVVADAARSEFACETVWAHVWTQNDEGLRWYMARGFACVEELKKYYHKLQPNSAWIVRRDIGPGSLLGLGDQGLLNTYSVGTESIVMAPRYSVTAAAANLNIYGSGGDSSLSPTPGTTPPQTLPDPLALSAATTTAAPSTSDPASAFLSNSGRSTSGRSFQNSRPETEWNDLPPDMQISKPGSGNLSVSATRSGASSRSSSSARKKHDRAYPAAAFGN